MRFILLMSHFRGNPTAGRRFQAKLEGMRDAPYGVTSVRIEPIGMWPMLEVEPLEPKLLTEAEVGDALFLYEGTKLAGFGTIHSIDT